MYTAYCQPELRNGNGPLAGHLLGPQVDFDIPRKSAPLLSWYLLPVSPLLRTYTTHSRKWFPSAPASAAVHRGRRACPLPNLPRRGMGESEEAARLKQSQSDAFVTSTVAV